MRLRNIPEAAGIIAESPYVIKDASSHKGQWNLFFDNDNPICVEIGMGKGRFIIEKAKQDSKSNYIGIERYTSVLLRAVQRLGQMEEVPSNLIFICEDARRLPELFGAGEVSKIFLNFSDPWPKDRHAKRRLTSPEFLSRYKEVLGKGGSVEFKTDNGKLFEYSVDTIDNAPEWEIAGVTRDLHSDGQMLKGNIMTEYEEKFVQENKPIFKLVAVLMSLLLLITPMLFPFVSYAREVWPAGVETESNSVVVLEQDSGAVLYRKKPNKKLYPASITKILTALVAIENSELDETVKFSHDAVYLNEGDTSHISREVGEKMTMEECLYGMLLESANECAWAIAEHVAGNEPDFVDMMNKRAAEIGCENTHFANPNGLPDEDHYTTSYDMALIAREAFKNKTFRTITGTRAYNIPPTNKHDVQTPLNNHHAMLNFYKTSKYLYEGCMGGKTGYTVAAGNTLVTYATRKGMTLVCVVMNAPSPGYYTDTIHLFDYCFDNFVTYPLSETAYDKAGGAGVGRLALVESFYVADKNCGVVLPKAASILDVNVTVEPVDGTEDGAIGVLSCTYGDRYVGGGNLYLSEEEEDYTYPFANLQETGDGDEAEEITVNYTIIAIAAGCAAGLIVLILLIKLISPIVHRSRMRRRETKRAKKRRYTKIRQNGRRRSRKRR